MTSSIKEKWSPPSRLSQTRADGWEGCGGGALSAARVSAPRSSQKQRCAPRCGAAQAPAKRSRGAAERRHGLLKSDFKVL